MVVLFQLTYTTNKQGSYQAPWWYNKHLASIVHLGTAPDIIYRREILVHDDGNLFSCDWFPSDEVRPRPCIYTYIVTPHSALPLLWAVFDCCHSLASLS